MAGINIFNGVAPSLGPFAPILETKIGMFIGVVWALAFFYCGYHLIEGIARAARSSSGGFSGGVMEARRDLGWSAAATIGLVALPAIWGVLIS
jgi:hypothetical protein